MFTNILVSVAFAALGFGGLIHTNTLPLSEVQPDTFVGNSFLAFLSTYIMVFRMGDKLSFMKIPSARTRLLVEIKSFFVSSSTSLIKILLRSATSGLGLRPILWHLIMPVGGVEYWKEFRRRVVTVLEIFSPGLATGTFLPEITISFLRSLASAASNLFSKISTFSSKVLT